MTAEKNDDDKDNDETDIVSVPSHATTLGALDTLRCYLQNADIASNTITHFNVLEKADAEKQPKQKQTSIDDFLKEECLH